MLETHTLATICARKIQLLVITLLQIVFRKQNNLLFNRIRFFSSEGVENLA